jgi:hypothetical protein
MVARPAGSGVAAGDSRVGEDRVALARIALAACKKARLEEEIALAAWVVPGGAARRRWP